MRRLRAVVAVAAAAAAGAGAGLATGAGSAPALPASASAKASALRTTSVGVGLREFRIALYRSRIRPGRVRLNLENLGEDRHDVQVLGPSGGATASVVRATSPEVRPGARYTLRLTLKRRGLYRLVCTIGDHEARGMVARLRVVRRL